MTKGNPYFRFICKAPQQTIDSPNVKTNEWIKFSSLSCRPTWKNLWKRQHFFIRPYKLISLVYSIPHTNLWVSTAMHTILHKTGCISANNGPIWKIKNLACSGLRCRCLMSQWRRATPAMTSRGRVMSCVTSSRQLQHVQSHCGLVAKQLLGGPYLWDRLVDFANFLHAKSSD